MCHVAHDCFGSVSLSRQTKGTFSPSAVPRGTGPGGLPRIETGCWYCAGGWVVIFWD